MYGFKRDCVSQFARSSIIPSKHSLNNQMQAAAAQHIVKSETTVIQKTSHH